MSHQNLISLKFNIKLIGGICSSYLTSRTAKDEFTSVKPFLLPTVFLLLGYPTLCFAAEALEAYSLAQGQMAGEVSDHSVILQTRITSSNPLFDKSWSGIPGLTGWACFEISTTSLSGSSHMHILAMRNRKESIIAIKAAICWFHNRLVKYICLLDCHT